MTDDGYEGEPVTADTRPLSTRLNIRAQVRKLVEKARYPSPGIQGFLDVMDGLQARGRISPWATQPVWFTVFGGGHVRDQLGAESFVRFRLCRGRWRGCGRRCASARMRSRAARRPP